MKKDIGTYEAKTRLPELLREVRAGYSFTITKHGQPVAALIPAADPGPVDRSATVARLKMLMRQTSGSEVDLKALIESGRA